MNFKTTWGQEKTRKIAAESGANLFLLLVRHN